MQESGVTRGVLRAGAGCSRNCEREHKAVQERACPALHHLHCTAGRGQGQSRRIPGFGSLKRCSSAHFIARSEIQQWPLDGGESLLPAAAPGTDSNIGCLQTQWGTSLVRLRMRKTVLPHHSSGGAASQSSGQLRSRAAPRRWGDPEDVRSSGLPRILRSSA